MATPIRRSQTPRKQPLQARSTLTVEAVLEASFQVLQREGYARFTTTRVAERAGVSVGSIYQYFPNRAALIAELLRRHLAAITGTVGAAAQAQARAPLPQLVAALVEALVAAKRAGLAQARLLQPAFDDVDGAPVIRAAMRSASDALAALFVARGDFPRRDPRLVAELLVAALSAPLSEWAMTDPERLADPAILAELQRLAAGYAGVGP